LHVGDFHYRKNPCIDSSAECGTSPFSDNWATWREEFFEPAKPLLLAAPWVIMRGNQEGCARAGAGWIFCFALPGRCDSECTRSISGTRTKSLRVGGHLRRGEHAPGRSQLRAVSETAGQAEGRGAGSLNPGSLAGHASAAVGSKHERRAGREPKWATKAG
jgi:hypothetical protein